MELFILFASVTALVVSLLETFSTNIENVITNNYLLFISMLITIIYLYISLFLYLGMFHRGEVVLLPWSEAINEFHKSRSIIGSLTAFNTHSVVLLWVFHIPAKIYSKVINRKGYDREYQTRRIKAAIIINIIFGFVLVTENNPVTSVVLRILTY